MTKKIFLLLLTCLLAFNVSAQRAAVQPSSQSTSFDYVDLGLPSGTLWKNKNEEGGFYTYGQAKAKFGNKLPTKEQFKELISSCRWTWTGSGYKVTGPSGKSIYMSAGGWGTPASEVYDHGTDGFYWSSTPYGSDKAYCLYFISSDFELNNSSQNYSFLVRLVAVLRD